MRAARPAVVRPGIWAKAQKTGINPQSETASWRDPFDMIFAHADQGVEIGIVDVTARRGAHVYLQDDVGGVAAREHLNAGVILSKARYRFI
jgi:hypothetical protein